MAIFPPATSRTSPMSGIYASLRQAQSHGDAYHGPFNILEKNNKQQ